jgi:6-phosphogluconolactonase
VFCFGDERNVPPDSPDSNARMAREALTGQPFVNQSSVYRIKGELPAEEAAADYEKTLRTLFPGTTTFPGFDLVLLGLGPDGHTASLFPHSAALVDRTRWVAANWVEKFRTHRITLTFPVLNAAAEVLFLVVGEDKAWALKEVLKGTAPVAEIPARGIVPTSGKVTFLVDRAAAAGLST